MTAKLQDAFVAYQVAVREAKVAARASRIADRRWERTEMVMSGPVWVASVEADRASLRACAKRDAALRRLNAAILREAK